MSAASLIRAEPAAGSSCCCGRVMAGHGRLGVSQSRRITSLRPPLQLMIDLDIDQDRPNLDWDCAASAGVSLHSVALALEIGVCPAPLGRHLIRRSAMRGPRSEKKSEKSSIRRKIIQTVMTQSLQVTDRKHDKHSSLSMA